MHDAGINEKREPALYQEDAFRSLPDILGALRQAGAQPSHARRVLRLWSSALPQDSGNRDWGRKV